jgi:hypothetical protein
MKSKQLTAFQYAVQGVGAVFVAVFLAAFLFSIPTTSVLHGQPIYQYLLAVFGGIFLILVLISLALSFIVKPSE